MITNVLGFEHLDSFTMERLLKICVLVLMASTTLGNDEATPAKLLFSKQILNKYLVEGMDVVIKYPLFTNPESEQSLTAFVSNSGIRFSTLVVVLHWMSSFLTTPSAPKISRLLVVQWKSLLVSSDSHSVGFTEYILILNTDRIPPGGNATHIAVIRPSKFGYFNFTSAEVSYLPSESATEAQIGYSSEPGQGAIVPFKEYDRKFSPHLVNRNHISCIVYAC